VTQRALKQKDNEYKRVFEKLDLPYPDEVIGEEYQRFKL